MIMKKVINSKSQIIIIISLAILFIFALLLRILGLGNTFESSDNVELAYKILTNHGYRWMVRENYGFLINIYVKIFVGILSLMGVGINEFWWKFPIAFLGSLQVFATYFLMCGMNQSKGLSLIVAGSVVFLPLHVFQSRILWGYEVLAVFFLTLAVYELIIFFKEPSVKRGLIASLLSALYLISHGYIIPFLPTLCLLCILYVSYEGKNIFIRFYHAIMLLIKKWVWFFPLIISPLLYYPLFHAFNKKTKLGFYFFDYFGQVIGSIGIGYLFFIILTLFVIIFFHSVINRHVLLCVGSSVFYLSPLFFGAQPGITVVRGYMLVGIYFIIIASILVMNYLLRNRKSIFYWSFIICFMLNCYGIVESIFYRDVGFDLSFIWADRDAKRGVVNIDPGSKTAGYIIRTYMPPETSLLSVHGHVEPSVLYYYFGRTKYSYYDLSPEQTLNKLQNMKDEVDIIICEDSYIDELDNNYDFERMVTIFAENIPQMYIYARHTFTFPEDQVSVEEYNKYYDNKYPISVSLL